MKRQLWRVAQVIAHLLRKLWNSPWILIFSTCTDSRSCLCPQHPDSEQCAVHCIESRSHCPHFSLGHPLDPAHIACPSAPRWNQGSYGQWSAHCGHMGKHILALVPLGWEFQFEMILFFCFAACNLIHDRPTCHTHIYEGWYLFANLTDNFSVSLTLNCGVLGTSHHMLNSFQHGILQSVCCILMRTAPLICCCN